MKPIKITGEATVPYWLNYLLNEFEYPDADTIAPNPMPGGGGGMFTYAIAAADASPFSAGKADQQASGVNDDETLMAGMGFVYNAGGGRLIISEGEYSVRPDEVIVGNSVGYPEPIILQGMGLATALTPTTTATTAAIRVAHGSKLRDALIGEEGSGG